MKHVVLATVIVGLLYVLAPAVMQLLKIIGVLIGVIAVMYAAG